MEYPPCHICKMIFNGERQYSDHLAGKRHRTNLKKAKRRQMQLKLSFEPDDKAPPSGLKDNPSPLWPRNPIMEETYPCPIKFPSKVFRISSCGTFMIHRDNGWTIKDCRTEQRQRWSKIRHAERMKKEKREREETVARWRERKCMKREDKNAEEPVKGVNEPPQDSGTRRIDSDVASDSDRDSECHIDSDVVSLDLLNPKP